MFDTIVRGGSVVDGSGSAAYTADIAIANGRIAEVGQLRAPARQVIDADGALVTPGFIDIHTHLDGQFIWDDRLDPAFSHGVTTAIAGNCGVGFAPVQPDHRKALIELMEGVEEIPGIVLEEGLDWRWRSFPDYLDRLAARSYALDVASHVTHAPLRVFVMGESGHGTFQIIPLGANGETYATSKEDANAKTRRAEHDRIARIAEASGRPVTYLLLQFRSDPDDWRMMIAESEQSLRAGRQVYPQVGSRGIGALTTLDGYHYFMMRRSYHEIAHLPLAKRVIALREPACRAAILSEINDPALVAADPKLAGFLEMLRPRMGGVYPMTGQSLDYEPGPERRLSTLAAAAGVSMQEYVYDHYTTGDGTNLCASFVLNYAEENLNATYEMLRRPIVAAALGDGGAHVRMMCDASWPTFQLAFWARDRKRGPTLPLEHVVNKLTKNNADLYGLRDRGVVAPGLRADLNVIDHQRLRLHLPRMTFDLPSGGGRMLQTSSGYLATLVGGEVTRRHDADTGARPGRLVRSGRTQ